MKVAYLYVRVSTDEQTKGYSPQNQEELLLKYCNLNGISVRKIIHEDFSAKTFNRPKWKQFLAELKKSRGKADLVLFTRWDRFSRNAGDAYQMINTLRKYGVEPQAVEQPLDLSIPENKMMLAFYLAAPEVENDRRALNTFHGMRRARKEGRYMGVAPVGYINRITEAGKKYIAPDEPEASIMRWAFTEIATGKYNTEQIFKVAQQKGIRCTRSNFWVALRNPVYCGKILVPKYKDEEETFVDGKHEPLISEGLFYQAQEILDGRKRHFRPKIVTGLTIPLRGFLICPLCGKILTGSVSKGRSQYYSYYHCFDGCSSRYRAELVNGIFVDELKKFIPKPGLPELLHEKVAEVFKDKIKAVQNDKRSIIQQINDLQNKLQKARDLLLSDDIDPADYKEMKDGYQKKIVVLEKKLSEFSNSDESIDKLLYTTVNGLCKLDRFYETGTIEEKRELIGSMYPEKLTFDGNSLRTARINQAALCIYNIINELEGKKKGTSHVKNDLSRFVPRTGFEPAHPCRRCDLNTVRLPISPPGHLIFQVVFKNFGLQR